MLLIDVPVGEEDIAAVLRTLCACHTRVGTSPLQNVHYSMGPGGGGGRRKEGMEREGGREGGREGERERERECGGGGRGGGRRK